MNLLKVITKKLFFYLGLVSTFTLHLYQNEGDVAWNGNTVFAIERSILSSDNDHIELLPQYINEFNMPRVLPQTSYFGWLKKEGEVYVGRHYFLIVTVQCDTFWHYGTCNCRCKSTKCSEVDWPIWSIGEMWWSLRRVTCSSDTNGACHKTWLLFKATKNKWINCTIFPRLFSKIYLYTAVAQFQIFTSTYCFILSNWLVACTV